MASDKRTFTNFKSFPGKISTDKDKKGQYEFPTLFTTTSTGKNRRWNVFVRLIKEDSKNIKATKKQNWDLKVEEPVSIKSSYLEDEVDFPDGIISQVWTESGFIGEGMKITRFAPTYPKITNKDRANKRNYFHQALVVARGSYLKKIDEGGVLHMSDLSKVETGARVEKIFPMLAYLYKDNIKNIKYPIFIQPKLDGMRCLAYLDKNPERVTLTNVILYSRQKKEYPINATTNLVREALFDILVANYNKKKKESLYLDGEFYKHGIPLQKISSLVRGTNIGGDEVCEYHIYDMFYPSYTNEPFSQRTQTLKSLYETLNATQRGIIKLVPTHEVESEKDNDDLYNKYISEGYEGIMIRTLKGPYKKSTHIKSKSLRSKDLLKRKEVYDDEFEVVDYTEGKEGKDVGAVIWICKTPQGYIFNVVPNATYEERYSIYKDCKLNFDKKYKNKMLTVEYRSLSDDKVPQHARGKNFRDFK